MGPFPASDDRLADAFRAISQAARDGPLDHVTPVDILRAVHGMRSKTGLGADRLTPLNIERLPPNGI
eukprot:3378165-Pyramimonas_sp.AAC.1